MSFYYDTAQGKKINPSRKREKEKELLKTFSHEK